MDTKITNRSFNIEEAVAPFVKAQPLTNRIFNRIPTSKVAGASNEKWLFPVVSDTDYVLVLGMSKAGLENYQRQLNQ